MNRGSARVTQNCDTIFSKSCPSCAAVSLSVIQKFRYCKSDGVSGTFVGSCQTLATLHAVY